MYCVEDEKFKFLYCDVLGKILIALEILSVNYRYYRLGSSLRSLVTLIKLS